ncbi:MAG: GNAT family N-acetyltransferase [Candidatus Kapabacteria bacterium]|nr:GNAT family N-acetyltransferase [Candidatus Kapabacteria bacterium]
MQLRTPVTEEDWQRYYDVRYRILRQPWGAPKGSEVDATDSASHNVMLCDGDTVAAVGRLHFNSAQEAQVRYMAVDTPYQGRGCGAIVMAELEHIAQSNGASVMMLEARDNAIGFYERMGYTVVKKSYLLFGEIQHYTMTKPLITTQE